MTNPGHSMLSRLQGFFPILVWLPGYHRGLLKWDILAGLTLAAFVFPESMAYATLAGLPPQFGIYCCLAGGLLFALFSSSRQVAAGPTSAISLMIGSSVALMAEGDPAVKIQIAALTAFAVALIALLAYLLKLSVIVNFISESVLLGFKAGAALSIISTQIPKIFGITGGGNNFFERLAVVSENLAGTNMAVLGLGLGALTLLAALHRIFPGKPAALLVVIGSVLLVSFTSLRSSSVPLSGELPAGLPAITIPDLRYGDLRDILGLALGCFLMGYIETISAARILAEKNGYEINPRQELLAMAAANAASGLAGGYVVSGGLSQSTVNDSAGARTPMALIIQSAVLVLMLLFLTGLLGNIPEVILSVIVIHAVAGLIKIRSLRHLYSLSRWEFVTAMVALFGVLWLGILNGILLAALISVLVIIKRATTPPVAILGRIPGTDMFSDITRHPDNLLIPGVLILRVESSVLYFNQTSVREQIMDYINMFETPTKYLVLDLSAAPFMDVGGAKMLTTLARELEQKGIHVRIAEALSEARDILRKLGMEEITGHITRKAGLHEVVESLESNSV